MIKYFMAILLTLIMTVNADKKNTTVKNIKGATKGKVITFSENAYFSNTDNFGGKKFQFDNKESFKHDYVNLHHPFSTLSSPFRGRFIAKFKLVEKLAAKHIDEIITHFKNKNKNMAPVIYFEVKKLNDNKSNVSGEVKIIGYVWLNTEERREKSSNCEIIKSSYFTNKNFIPLSKEPETEHK